MRKEGCGETALKKFMCALEKQGLDFYRGRIGVIASGATWCNPRIQMANKDPTYDTICPRCKQ